MCKEAVEISITSHAGVAPARLLLRVGPAPSLLPRAGAAAQVCSQAAGTSCTIDVVAAAGEVNPLPRTPMELVGVRAAGTCTGVTFEVASPRSVIARWTADTPGSTCAAVFSLRDAQGRVTAGERDGSLLLDLQGFPRAPGGVVQAGYGDGHVTLRVDPGEARSAYPALTGFTVRTARIRRGDVRSARSVRSDPGPQRRRARIRGDLDQRGRRVARCRAHGGLGVRSAQGLPSASRRSRS